MTSNDASSSTNAAPEEEAENALGFYRFEPAQLKAIRDLATVMRQCSCVWALLTVADVFLATTHMCGLTDSLVRVGVPYSDLASIFHDAIMAFVVYNASVSFQMLLHWPGNHMTYVFEGIVRLTNLFLQLSVFLTSISVIQLIEAALVWPGIKLYVYIVFTSIAVLRSVAVTYVHAKYSQSYLQGAAAVWRLRTSVEKKPFYEGLMLSLAGSFLVHKGLPAKQDSPQSALPLTSPTLTRVATTKEFEFPYWNEQILLAVVEAMRMCGLCYVLECMSTLFLASSLLTAGSMSQGLLSFIDVMTDVAVFNVVLHAADAFQRIVTTEGHDIANLMIALGRKGGLTDLFTRLGHIASSLVIAQSSTAVLKLLEVAPAWASAPATGMGGAMIAFAGYTFYDLWCKANPEKVVKIVGFFQRPGKVQLKPNLKVE